MLQQKTKQRLNTEGRSARGGEGNSNFAEDQIAGMGNSPEICAQLVLREVELQTPGNDAMATGTSKTNRFSRK